MSRKGFWHGVLVGAIVTGLLVAVALFVVARVRWPAAALYGLRGRQFGVNPHGWFAPRMPGHWLGFGAMLCGPLLLLAGALVVGALLGRRWHSRRQAKLAPSAEQPSAVEPGVTEVNEPPADAGQGENNSQATGSIPE